MYTEWKANAIGRNAKTVREFLEKNWTAETVADEAGAVKIAVKALLEVVQLGGKNLEVRTFKQTMRQSYLRGADWLNLKIGSGAKKIFGC